MWTRRLQYKLWPDIHSIHLAIWMKASLFLWFSSRLATFSKVPTTGLNRWPLDYKSNTPPSTPRRRGSGYKVISKLSYLKKNIKHYQLFANFQYRTGIQIDNFEVSQLCTYTCACVVLWIPFPRRCYTSAMRHFLLFFSRFHFNLIEKKKKWKPRSAIPSCLFCHFQAKSL